MKLLVAATPISGPQFRIRTESLILARDEVDIFTIERIFDPFSFAFLTECNTSAVSPLWEMAIIAELGSKVSEYIEIHLTLLPRILSLQILPKGCFPIIQNDSLFRFQ